MWKPSSPTASVVGYASAHKQLKVNIASRGREISFEKLFFQNIFATDYLNFSKHRVNYLFKETEKLYTIKSGVN